MKDHGQALRRQRLTKVLGALLLAGSYLLGERARLFADTTSSLSWEAVVGIDCTAIPPTSEVGQSRVVDSALGRYREAGPRIGDRFVYPFRLAGPNRVVRATITYPDDAIRTAGVSAWGPPQEALGSGYMCGDDIPLSQQMMQRQYVFFSRDQDAALVFSTEAPNQPVAISSLLIEDAPASLPPAPPPAISARIHRRIGLTWEDPILARCFGEPDSVNGDGFELVLQRCMEYSRWAGLSEISYPAYWYTGPVFKSHVLPSSSIANRLHPPDALTRLANRCQANDIAYFPVLNIFKLRPLMQHMLDEQQVIAGTPGINTVGADGRIVTWTNAQLWRDCVSVPLHPIVQGACQELLVEVATQCAPYTSFKGVDLALWPGTILKLGSSAPGDAPMSFDDYTVAAFCADSRLQPPGNPSEPDRFARRAQWLRDDPSRWNAWLMWRAEHMTQFYNSLAQNLASIKRGAKLGICIYPPTGRPENEGIDVNAQIYASGIDLDALSKNPNITIKRYAQQMLPRWRLRNGMPRPRNLNIENTAKFQVPFANRAGMSFMINQQYFETRADINGTMLTLPEPYPTEEMATGPNATIRVTEPLPTGRDYLRFFAYAMRNFDPYSMSVGGYVLGTQGAEPELRELAGAFSALPATKFEPVTSTEEFIVRHAVAEGRVWVYAVNLTAQPQTIALSIEGGDVVNAVTGRTIDRPGGQVVIHLKAYELVSLCGPESLKVRSSEMKENSSR